MSGMNGPSTPVGMGNPMDEPGGIRVTLDLPTEAAEMLRKILEAEAKGESDKLKEIGALGVSSLQVEGSPIIKLKSYKAQQATNPYLETKSASSSNLLKSGDSKRMLSNPSSIPSLSSSLSSSPNKISLKGNSSKNRNQQSFDAKSLKNHSAAARLLQGVAAGDRAAALKIASSPLLVNLLKQESNADAFYERSNGLESIDRRRLVNGGHHNMRSPNPLLEGLSTMKASSTITSASTAAAASASSAKFKTPSEAMAKRSKLEEITRQMKSTTNTDSEDKNSVRLKLKLPLSTGEESNGESNSTPGSVSGESGRKIPKLILSMKDRTIIKKDPRTGKDIVTTPSEKSDPSTPSLSSCQSAKRSMSCPSGEEGEPPPKKKQTQFGSAAINDSHANSEGYTNGGMEDSEPKATSDANKQQSLTSSPPTERLQNSTSESKPSSSSTSETSVDANQDAHSQPSSSQVSVSQSSARTPPLPSSPSSVSSQGRLSNGSKSSVISSGSSAVTNSKMVPVKLVTVSGEGNVRLVKVSPVKTSSTISTTINNEPEGAHTSSTTSTTAPSKTVLLVPPQTHASSNNSSIITSPSDISSSSGLTITASSTTTLTVPSHRNNGSPAPSDVPISSQNGSHESSCSDETASQHQQHKKTESANSTKFSKTAGTNNRENSQNSGLTVHPVEENSLTIIPSNSTSKCEVVTRPMLIRPQMKRKIVSTDELKKLMAAGSEALPVSWSASATATTANAHIEKGRIATRSTKIEDSVSKGRKT